MKIDIEKDLWQYLAEAEKPIVLYGMGNGADKVLDRLQSLGIEVAGVFASDDFVRHQQFRDYTVCSYDELKQQYGQMIVLVCFGTFLDEVIDNIRRIASEQELYAPDVPAYGDLCFTADYYRENEQRFQRLYDRLADEQSRLTLKNAVLYKLTGKIDYLFECESDEQEVQRNVLRLGGDESYLDLGAYNGDTVERFVQTVGNYREITAAEPDRKTYQKLLQRVGHLSNLNAINAAVGDHVGQTEFAMRGGRNSSVGMGEKIDVVTVDSLLLQRVTYIKMDVEGEEAAVIRGAAGLIARFRPKMLVSAYHRSEDLLDLFEQIMAINDGYRVYLRHFRYIPCWDLNYYFL